MIIGNVERIETTREDLAQLVREIQEKGGRIVGLFFYDGETTDDGVRLLKVWTPRDVKSDEMRSVIASGVYIHDHVSQVEKAERHAVN